MEMVYGRAITFTNFSISGWSTVQGLANIGKGKEYSRPVLIFKKLGKYTFIGIPLSTSKKTGRLYYQFVLTEGKISTALLTHIKSFDSRRLLKKIGTLETILFEEIRKAVKDML